MKSVRFLGYYFCLDFIFPTPSLFPSPHLAAFCLPYLHCFILRDTNTETYPSWFPFLKDQLVNETNESSLVSNIENSGYKHMPWIPTAWIQILILLLPPASGRNSLNPSFPIQNAGIMVGTLVAGIMEVSSTFSKSTEHGDFSEWYCE